MLLCAQRKVQADGDLASRMRPDGDPCILPSSRPGCGLMATLLQERGLTAVLCMRALMGGISAVPRGACGIYIMSSP